LETPNVDGEAMELFSVVCIIRPDTDNPAPAIMAARTLGTRIFQIIRTFAAVPFPANASSASVTDILEEPANRQINPRRITQTAITIIIAEFL
jgi:hypothetical protein